MEKILETDRLYLRKMTWEDYPDLCRMLQNEEVMYAYEHAFSDQEAREWLRRQLNRYEQYGFGLWAVLHRDSGAFIGQCGLTMQPTEDGEVLEVGYLFCKEFWHQGYATEAARACRDYAFQRLGAQEVFSIIRENNLPSRRVAERNGMQVRGTLVKQYYGMTMPHLIYSVKYGESDQ